MIADKQHYRKQIIDYLELVASKKAQLEYQISVPVADVPAELFCMWFDDLYTPADDPSIYNPGVFEEGVREFESCFSTEEIEALKKFHEHFESVADAIPPNLRLEELQTNRLWREVMVAAVKALEVFRSTPN